MKTFSLRPIFFGALIAAAWPAGARSEQINGSFVAIATQRFLGSVITGTLGYDTNDIAHTATAEFNLAGQLYTVTGGFLGQAAAYSGNDLDGFKDAFQFSASPADVSAQIEIELAEGKFLIGNSLYPIIDLHAPGTEADDVFNTTDAGFYYRTFVNGSYVGQSISGRFTDFTLNPVSEPAEWRLMVSFSMLLCLVIGLKQRFEASGGNPT